MSPAKNELSGPLRVAFVGVTGSGKSTLINAIMGRKILKTGAAADTTDSVDKVEYKKGHLVLIDTPGVGGCAHNYEETTITMLGLNGSPDAELPDVVVEMLLESNKQVVAFHRRLLQKYTPIIVRSTHVLGTKQSQHEAKKDAARLGVDGLILLDGRGEPKTLKNLFTAIEKRANGQKIVWPDPFVVCPECDGSGKGAPCSCKGVKVRCSACKGSGERKVREECDTCGGRGWITEDDIVSKVKRFFTDDPENEKCTKCVGGKVWKLTRCGKCRGTGKVKCAKCGGSGILPCKVCNGKGKVRRSTLF